MKFQKIKSIRETKNDDIIHFTVEKNHNFFANRLCVHNCGYRGEIGVIMYNSNAYYDSIKISHGDRIAQLVLQKVPKMVFERVESVDATDRGEGGFGSTGEK